MKRKLLFLGLLLISISMVFGATDISDSTQVISSVRIGGGVYGGYVFTPSIVLVNKTTNATLNQGTDYTVSYTLNGNQVSTVKDAGIYEVVVAGIGNYTGRLNPEFTVLPANLDNVVISGVNGSYPYEGTQIAPAIGVTLNGQRITSADYTLTYGDNTTVADGGTITLTPSDNKNFAGQKVVNFAIAPVNLSTATTVVALSQSSYVYNGSIITPTIQSVTVDGKTLSSSDYTVSSPGNGANTNVGNGTVTITGAGNYTGTVSQRFTITDADLSTATITLNPASYAYTGSVVTPTIQSVVVGGRTLAMNTDYTVAIPSAGTNTNVGNGTVMISGTGNYTGSASKSFSISGATLTDDMIVAIASKTYTGAAITLDAADIATSYSSKPLMFGTDYTITGYQSNTALGTATVTFEGAGSFSGKVAKTFEIEQAPLTADMFTITDTTYTGSAIKLTPNDITAKDAQQQTLTIETDFVIQNAVNNVNAGTATVIFTGKGNYSGTVPVNFTINKAALKADMFTVANKVYTGNPVQLVGSDITASLNSTPLVYGTDYTLGTYTNNTNVGTASVVISGTGNFEGDVTVNFNISAPAFTANMFAIANKAYTGSPVALTASDITVVNYEDTLVYGTDYTLGTYTNNTNAGTATVVINGAGNYNGSSLSVPFVITPIPLTASLFTTIASKAYTGAPVELTAQDITSSLVYDTDYTIGTYDHNINAGTAAVVFNGKGNYTGSTVPVSFTITPVALTAEMVTVLNRYYTGGIIRPQPVVKLGNIILSNSNYTVSYPDTQVGAYIEEGSYNVRVDAVANGNLTGSVIESFEIVEAPETYYTVTIPQVEGVTTDPPAGTYDVTDGNYFVFYITVDPPQQITVKVNGEVVTPYYLGNNEYEVMITDIEENINVEIKTGDVGNMDISTENVKVYGVNGMLYVETPTIAQIQVYSINGQLRYHGKTELMTTGIPLSRGIYIVKVDNKTFKAHVK
ncbi:MAG: hypothetical protein LBV72_12055 [Tannerella sp.]|nr:hypothetical protein [Tannerella sp.]